MKTINDLARPIILFGCGKMGSALLQRWLASGLNPQLVKIIQPRINEYSKTFTNCQIVTDYNLLRNINPLVIILAVKPQNMDNIMPQVVQLSSSDTMIISIAAGKSLSYFANFFAQPQPIIRVMPNTPAMIGRGVSVLIANEYVSMSARMIADVLCRTAGLVEWINDEKLMDVVSAISGSGPAYVFFLIECLTNIAIARGLDPQCASRIACATVAGAGELVHLSTDNVEKLRFNVTSPGGTTEQAIAVLDDKNNNNIGRLEDLLGQAIDAAIIHSRKL